MAVLEKIRKRSVILFIVIIGALLAFILGDFINSGRTFIGPGDTVASVGNVKVKHNELADYSKNVDDQIKQQIAQAQARGSYVPAEYLDPDFAYYNAIQSLLYEKLLEDECEKMGIEINDELLTNFVYSPAAQEFVYSKLYGTPENYQQFAAMGIADPASYLDAIKNPARYKLNDDIASQLAANWADMEKEIDKNLRTYLYSRAIGGLFQPNKADAMVEFENANTMATIDYVSVPYASVNDTEVELADADYQAAYDRNKGAYAIKDENREIAYIVVPVQASEKDYQTAIAEVAALKADLTTTDGLSALSEYKSFNAPEMSKVTAAQLQFAFRNDSTTDVTIGAVAQVGPYGLIKVLGKEEGIGNVTFDFYPAESVAQLDSIFADKSYNAVDSLIQVQTGGQFSDLSTSIVSPSAEFAQFFQFPSFKDKLSTAALNEYVAVADTLNGQPLAYALVVKERSTPETFYEVASINRDIYPSNETRSDLIQKLHAYVASNGNAKAFAEGTDYPVSFSLINPSSFTLDNSNATPNTRTLVKWAMNADKGAVSPVFTKQKTVLSRGAASGTETDEYLIALAVLDVYGDDYIPVTSNVVKEQLRGLATNDKKAEVITKKYNGKNVNDYAKAAGASVQTMPVTFGGGSLGREAQGAVASAQKGTFVGPVKGNTAVYVFTVKDVNTTGKFEDKDLKTRLEEVRTFNPVNFQNPQLFIGDRKLVDNMLIFTADETAE